MASVRQRMDTNILTLLAVMIALYIWFSLVWSFAWCVRHLGRNLICFGTDVSDWIDLLAGCCIQPLNILHLIL
jgi:hypothetical protein